MTITQLRQSARQIWDAALQRANPLTCLQRHFSVRDGVLSVAGIDCPLGGRLFVVGAGKAGSAMAQAVETLLGDEITAGIVVTRYGAGLPSKRIEILEAGHPIPDAAGVRAVARIRELISDLVPDDIVLCLLSGGGSALWPAPASGITLEEKQDVTSRLLRAGAGIRELNAVRKHLSAIKGGQLAHWALPARVISLIMSDVIDDPLDFIASGPTAPDTTTFADALAIIRRYEIKPSAAVMERLQNGKRGRIPETVKPGDAVFANVNNVIIANNRLLVDAARERAEALGFTTLILGTGIDGEAREVARVFAAIASEIGQTGNPIRKPACVIAAGETTVTVKGDGLGGRNQEMALAWSISMAGRREVPNCCFASIATDGSDGPTNAAGGLVDPLTCGRAAELGMSPLKHLDNNDSFHLLKSTGDLVLTGPTQTNLMDLQILLVA